MQALLDAGADPNAQDELERTPLHFETMRDNSETVRVLLDAGADPNGQNVGGRTPLHLAKGSDTVQILLDAGANPNASDEGQIPLHRIAECGNTKGVRALLDAGANPNARTEHGQTPLHHAKHPETARALLNAGADPNARADDGQTPLHCAVRRNLESVQALLEAGGRPETHEANAFTSGAAQSRTHTTSTKTPLYLAGLRDGATDIVQTLIDAGADVTVENGLRADAFPVRTQEQRYPNGGDSA